MARIPKPAPTLSRGVGRTKHAKKTSPTQPSKNKNQDHTEQKKNPTPKLGKKPKSTSSPPRVQENIKKTKWSAAEKRQSAMHGVTSIFICVTLDPPYKRAIQVYLQTPRTSYSSRRSRVARRRKRKLDRSRVVPKSNQIYPIRWCSRADFPEPPQTVVALVPNVDPVGKHGRRSQSACDTQPKPGVRNRSPLLRERSRCAALILVRRYRRLVWRCWFGVPAQ